MILTACIKIYLFLVLEVLTMSGFKWYFKGFKILKMFTFHHIMTSIQSVMLILTLIFYEYCKVILKIKLENYLTVTLAKV